MQQLVQVETILNCTLPESFKSFLSRWNGVILFKGESRPGCRIFDTDTMMSRNRIWQTQELLPEEQAEDIVLFADAGDGDFFAFDVSKDEVEGKYPVLDGDHNFAPGEWNVICDNFEAWLDRFVKAQGMMFW